jgi:phosphatidylserine decarboxylase
MTIRHQYVERDTRAVRTERLYGDRVVAFLYSRDWESAPALFRLFTAAWSSRLLGFLLYDTLLGSRIAGSESFARANGGIDPSECVESVPRLDTLRKLFERQIRYWECRPMPEDPGAVVSPADSRVLVGSLRERSALFLKGKFFDYEELLGSERRDWLRALSGGDFAVFRLTPDKYHYTHVPVSGKVADVYAMAGRYHSCNPGAVVALGTPHSKNKRVVTILDTDVRGGSGAGIVAVVEVGALMVGDIVQCYSEERYDAPRPVARGMFLRRGCPKSLFRPGGSTVVVLFQNGRVRFDDDIVSNMFLPGVRSRLSHGFGQPLVETEVKVRSRVAIVMRRQ